MDKVLEQLESMQKDRQILSAHGATVYHECKSVSLEVQGALKSLQSNAAANARKKKGGTVPRASSSNRALHRGTALLSRLFYRVAQKSRSTMAKTTK